MCNLNTQPTCISHQTATSVDAQRHKTRNCLAPSETSESGESTYKKKYGRLRQEIERNNNVVCRVFFFFTHKLFLDNKLMSLAKKQLFCLRYPLKESRPNSREWKRIMLISCSIIELAFFFFFPLSFSFKNGNFFFIKSSSFATLLVRILKWLPSKCLTYKLQLLKRTTGN